METHQITQHGQTIPKPILTFEEASFPGNDQIAQHGQAIPKPILTFEEGSFPGNDTVILCYEGN